MIDKLSSADGKMNLEAKPGNKPAYQIKVQGKLNQCWSDWLGGVTFSYERENVESPITTLIVPIADQSALRGTLNKLWDLNLTLLSVVRIGEPRLDEPFDE
jgi:hypothetical protein